MSHKEIDELKEELRREKARLVEVRAKERELARWREKEIRHAAGRLILKVDAHLRSQIEPSVALKMNLDEAMRRLPGWLGNLEARALMSEPGDWMDFEKAMRARGLW